MTTRTAHPQNNKMVCISPTACLRRAIAASRSATHDLLTNLQDVCMPFALRACGGEKSRQLASACFVCVILSDAVRVVGACAFLCCLSQRAQRRRRRMHAKGWSRTQQPALRKRATRKLSTKKTHATTLHRLQTQSHSSITSKTDPTPALCWSRRKRQIAAAPRP